MPRLHRLNRVYRVYGPSVQDLGFSGPPSCSAAGARPPQRLQSAVITRQDVLKHSLRPLYLPFIGLRASIYLLSHYFLLWTPADVDIHKYLGIFRTRSSL